MLFLFRESRKSIQNVCRKFMEHPDHLENHFKYLTSTDGLTAVVEKNFKHQIGKQICFFLPPNLFY